MTKQVIVYSTTGCKECNMVKDVLSQEGISFEVRDIMNPAYQEEVEKFGFMGIPVTAVGDKAIKGFNPAELNKLIELVRS